MPTVLKVVTRAGTELVSPGRRALFLCGALALVFGALASGTVEAQEWSVVEDHDWCGSSWRGAECEVREIVLPVRDLVRIDASQNGGIEIRGWDKDSIRILAKVQVHRERGDDRGDLMDRIQIRTDGVIEPEGSRQDGWGVSFRVYVPRSTNLDLRAYNGGLSIEGVQGELEFDTHNGGIRLVDSGGEVSGTTRNGGIEVELTGSTWDGEGLNLETTNGGIFLRVPDRYSARLITGTVNGRLELDRDFDLRGRVGKKGVRTTLGDGGPLIRVVTTNGGVQLQSN